MNETHLVTKTSILTFCGLVCSEKIKYLREGEKDTITKFCKECRKLAEEYYVQRK